MEAEAKERTNLQQVLDTLPKNHTALRDAQALLSERGKAVKRSTLYQVVKGRSNNPDLIEAILDAAEAIKKRGAALATRAHELAQA